MSAETLEPLACFVRKLRIDSHFADESYPGLEHQEFPGPFSTNHSFVQISQPDKLVTFLEFSSKRRPSSKMSKSTVLTFDVSG